MKLSDNQLEQLDCLYGRINDFDAECEEHEYTDTDMAWDILRHAEGVLANILDHAEYTALHTRWQRNYVKPGKDALNATEWYRMIELERTLTPE